MVLSKKGEPVQEIANNSWDGSCLTHEKVPWEQLLLILACFLLGALSIVAKLITPSSNIVGDNAEK